QRDQEQPLQLRDPTVGGAGIADRAQHEPAGQQREVVGEGPQRRRQLVVPRVDERSDHAIIVMPQNRDRWLLPRSYMRSARPTRCPPGSRTQTSRAPYEASRRGTMVSTADRSTASRSSSSM